MVSATPSTDFGRRLIPRIIDEHAEVHPESPVYSIPRTVSLEDGFDNVTWLQLANAINRVAWCIEDNLGRSDTFESIAYFGPTDIGYAIITVAAQKTGYKVFFSSPWNNLETHLHLLESSNCRLLITSFTPPEFVDDITKRRPMKHLRMPEITKLLNGPSVQVYAYTKGFQQAQLEPFALFHTSGTTGFPKLIVITHGTMAACDAYQSAHIFGYARTQVDLFKGKRVLAGLPPCHAAGMFHFLAMPTFYGSIPVIAPPTALTAALTSEMLEHGDVNVLILRPNVLSEIADEPKWLERLGSLDYVMSAACVLPKRVGDKIATKTSVTTYMGATETMLVPLKLLDRQDWEYITPSEVMGAEFRHHGEDLYELFIVRHPDLKAYQAIFFTFPDLQEYSMKDLYSRHPTEPCLWRYRGRVDDIIQLSNGRKILPAAMESAVASHPDVKTAVALGQAREKTALLIEVRDECLLADRATLLDSITPSLEAANQAYPEYARITKDRVLFATSAKPMVRTQKGTVQRVTMSKVYEEELDRVTWTSLRR